MLRERIPVTEAVGVIVVLMIGFGVAFIIWPEMKSQDAAAWLAAVGTLLAFAGTIWIATSERRRQTQESETAGLVIAIALAERVIFAASNMLATSNSLKRMGEINDVATINQCIFGLNSIHLWSPEEIFGLTKVHSHFALQLAATACEIKIIIQLLRNLEQALLGHVRLYDPDEDQLRVQIVEQVERTLIILKSCVSQCRQANARLIRI